MQQTYRDNADFKQHQLLSNKMLHHDRFLTDHRVTDIIYRYLVCFVHLRVFIVNVTIFYCSPNATDCEGL